MNGTASYAFLPWIRRGVATEITRIDGEAGTAARAEVPIELAFDAGGVLQRASVALALHGPGEVVGIDPRIVIRTVPRADVFDAENNYFPAIEFDQPDFPWRYTPARANAGQPGRAPANAAEGARLRPWLVLIVLSDDEIELFEPANADGMLPAITVISADRLPNLAQSWAWAHAQLAGLHEGESVAGIVEGQPHRVLSRLLCPRRLRPRTVYTACVVPSFERGRRAGLNEVVDADANSIVDALTPAWTDGQLSIRLPVYYQWRFQTGVAGDFEYLVRQLRARALAGSVGRRDMDTSAPGAGLPAASSNPLGLEGALRLPQRQPPAEEWNPAERNRFLAALRPLVNLPAVRLTQGNASRVVVPPLYGRWHAGRDRLLTIGQPSWFHELNGDPRLRVSAGLGTQVVQQQQEQLMAGAWQQVGEILEITRRMRLAQLARETTRRVRDRHVATLAADETVLVTAPLLPRIAASPQTIHALLRQSPVRDAVLDGQFRRIARPLGPIGKRQGRPAGTEQPALVDRLNDGKLSPAKPPPTPSEIFTPSRGGAGLVPPWATTFVQRLLRELPAALIVLAILALLFSALLLTTSLTLALVLGVVAIASGAAALVVRRLDRTLRVLVGLRAGTLTGDALQQAPAARSFVPVEAAPGTHTPVLRPTTGSAAERQAVADLRTALAALFTQTNTTPAAGVRLVSADLPFIRTRIVSAIDPEVTLVQPMRGKLRINTGVTWQPQDPLEPPMAAPTFDQPMYEPLRDLSQDWLLPGVASIPANTTTLLVTNQRFVEAYMAGLNHEMARELLWREYPTDQRGTCFRQFWDVRGYVPPTGIAFDPETLRDIIPLHTWQETLGAHSSRTAPSSGEHLVLLIRGEVLRRYPGAIVYAQRAVRSPEGPRVLSEAPDARRDPVFGGSLDPDIAFYGFDLTPEEVRGSTAPNADQGWFFVLQEQPTEPRFGLDVPDSRYFGAAVSDWQDLSWAHLAADTESLDNLGYIDLNAALPDTRTATPAGLPPVRWHAEQGLGDGGSRASDIAFITLQQPFRAAKHASDMLPPP